MGPSELFPFACPKNRGTGPTRWVGLTRVRLVPQGPARQRPRYRLWGLIPGARRECLELWARQAGVGICGDASQ